MESDDLTADVAAARQGDHQAFGRLVAAIHDEVRIFVAVRLADPALVDEVVQAALITVWRVLPRYEERGSFLPWVKGIALNHVRKQLSARARDRGRPLDALLASEDASVLGQDEPRLDRLRRCLDGLEAGVRRLIELRYGEGLDLDAVAERVGRSSSALAVKFHRVRQALRRCVELADRP